VSWLDTLLPEYDEIREAAAKLSAAGVGMRRDVLVFAAIDVAVAVIKTADPAAREEAEALRLLGKLVEELQTCAKLANRRMRH